MRNDHPQGGERSEADRRIRDDRRRTWTFLGSHAQVLLCVYRNPDALIRDIAAQAGISDRAVQLVLRDLEDEGYITCIRIGRRNRYEVHTDRQLRHPLAAGIEVLTLLSALEPAGHGDAMAEPGGDRDPA